MLEVQSLSDGETLVLSLKGELDIGTVDILKNDVEEVNKDVKTVILDMKHLSFVDSTGVGGLLSVIRGLRYENIKVKMRNVTESVYEVFDILGLPLLLGKEVFEQE